MARPVRWTVLMHYGGIPQKCSCCGESEVKFLTIDHVNNDGAKHRKEIVGNLTQWLLKNGLPEGFQILCYNCNCAKGFFGTCPHKQKVVLFI